MNNGETPQRHEQTNVEHGLSTGKVAQLLPDGRLGVLQNTGNVRDTITKTLQLNSNKLYRKVLNQLVTF